MPHPAGAGGLPPLGLHGPPELADLGRGEAAGGANLLLDVEGHLKYLVCLTSDQFLDFALIFCLQYLSTSPTHCVRFVPPHAKGAGTLRHGEAFLLRSEIL